MATFDISKVLDKSLITVDLQATDKEAAISELTDLLVQNGAVVDKKAFVEDVIAREAEGMTGLGQGVAIPHGKSKAVKTTSLAIGISQHMIPWESLDGEPINTIILFAVRDQDADTLHIKLLQKVAILLADDEFIEELHKVKTTEEVLTLFERDPGEE